MSDAAGIVLKVNGADYGGWLGQSAGRSIEQVCGSFNLTMTDRWRIESVAPAIRPGDECQILVDGESVLLTARQLPHIRSQQSACDVVIRQPCANIIKFLEIDRMTQSFI